MPKNSGCITWLILELEHFEIFLLMACKMQFSAYLLCHSIYLLIETIYPDRKILVNMKI